MSNTPSPSHNVVLSFYVNDMAIIATSGKPMLLVG